MYRERRTKFFPPTSEKGKKGAASKKIWESETRLAARFSPLHGRTQHPVLIQR